MIIIYINIIECRLISTIVFIDQLFMRKHFILFSQYMCIHLPLIFLYRIEFLHLKFILFNEILQVIITLHLIILYKRHFIGLDTLRLVKGRKKSAVSFGKYHIPPLWKSRDFFISSSSPSWNNIITSITISFLYLFFAT